MHINLFVAKSPSPPPEEAGKWKGWGRCVVFVDDVDALDLAKIGPLFECDPVFPKKINTEFVQVLSRTHLKMKVII